MTTKLRSAESPSLKKKSLANCSNTYIEDYLRSRFKNSFSLFVRNKDELSSFKEKNVYRNRKQILDTTFSSVTFLLLLCS